jgi:hypothetical protein
MGIIEFVRKKKTQTHGWGLAALPLPPGDQRTRRYSFGWTRDVARTRTVRAQKKKQKQQRVPCGPKNLYIPRATRGHCAGSKTLAGRA